MSKIAVVHDYFIQMGGAEKVAEEIHKLFPSAPMFTTVDQRRKFRGTPRAKELRGCKSCRECKNIFATILRFIR